MKILILARGIPSEDNPQEGCFEWDQANALKSIGHKPILVSLDARRRRSHHKWGISRIIKDGIEHYSIYGGTTTIIEHFVSFRFAQWYNKWLTKKLIKHVIKEHPDIKILHAHYLRCIYRAAALHGKIDIPIIGTEHLSDVVADKISSRIRSMASVAYRNIDQLITVSSYLQTRIREEFKVESITCGNVLGMEFLKTPLLDSPKNKNFTFIACGSLREIKGYRQLIEAFAKNKFSNCQLLIIGSGEQEPQLKALIKSRELSDKVKLLGQKKKEEIIRLLDSAHCFVLSSLKETFGVVVIEALSRGLPVISTQCGGIDGLVDSSNGILVKVNDIDAMAAAMNKMKESITIYNSSQIAEDCLNKYSPKIIAKKLEKIYCNVINS